MTTKSVGWVLLILGLIIILTTLYQSYNIFTGRAKIPKIFIQKTEISQLEENQETNSDSNINIDEMAKQIVQEQLKQILPSFPNEAIIQLLNLFCWSIFSGIAIFAGTQISGLGIKLIKTV